MQITSLVPDELVYEITFALDKKYGLDVKIVNRELITHACIIEYVDSVMIIMLVNPRLCYER